MHLLALGDADGSEVLAEAASIAEPPPTAASTLTPPMRSNSRRWMTVGR